MIDWLESPLEKGQFIAFVAGVFISLIIIWVAEVIHGRLKGE